MFLDWRIGAVGYAAAAVLGWMYIDKVDELARAEERCNTEKVEALLQADRVARKAGERAAAAHLAELDKMAEELATTRKKLTESQLVAQESQLRATQVIREAALNAPDSCLNVAIDPAVVDGLREREDR